MKKYAIYPGIEVLETNECTKLLPALAAPPQATQNILEINYCHKGRMERRMADGCLQYLGEGDLFLNTGYNQSKTAGLPLGYYQGITIIIDLVTAAAGLPALLPGLSVNLIQMAGRLFEQDDCLFLSARKSIDTIFHSIYTIPDEAKVSLLRLKVLELILYLHYLDIDAERCRKTYTRPQVDLIKQVHDQIVSNPGCRFTIDELSRRFCISPTTLKTNFKGVYGTSIMTYIRQYRIKHAATLLRESGKSIAEIAEEVGYESQSKFGAAFKEIMKCSPMEYRQKSSAPKQE